MSKFLLIASILAIIFSGLSLICSILNLILIRQLKQWNGFLAILWYMAWCQIIYDSTFYLSFDTNINHTADSVWDFMQGFGGLSVNIWTNVMSGVIVYIVMYGESFDILKEFWKLSLVVYMPSLAIAIIELTCSLLGHNMCVHILAEFYYWIRILSIVFNFWAFALIYWKIGKMKSNMRKVSAAELSIAILSRRMMYYPMIQLLSRMFNAVYEEVYGFGPYPGNEGSSGDRTQFIIQCLACITQPAAGIGFLVVFLIFQPRAWKQFKSLVTSGSFVTELDTSTIPVIVSYDLNHPSTCLNPYPIRESESSHYVYAESTINSPFRSTQINRESEFPAENISVIEQSYAAKEDNELLKIIMSEATSKSSWTPNNANY